MTCPNPNSALSDLPRPLAAVMSSGFFGFFAHAGFLQGLADLGLRPDAYAGCSSGALVAAFAAAGVSPADMLALFSRLTKERFWDPPRGLSLLRWLASGLRGRTSYLAGQAFEALLDEFLPAARFEDCVRPCLMVALDMASGQRVVLDTGPLALAVRASGAVPGLFAAVPRGSQLLVDGGLVDKAPLMASLERLRPASMVVHLLPSASLEQPLAATLGRSLTPLRLHGRAVDAARQQTYQDQLVAVRSRGARVAEVAGRGLPRCGPRKLQNGPAAFEAARQNVLAQLAGGRPTD